MNAITEIKTVLSAVKTTGDSKQEKLCPQSHPLYSPKTPRCHQSLRLGPNGESFWERNSCMRHLQQLCFQNVHHSVWLMALCNSRGHTDLTSPSKKARKKDTPTQYCSHHRNKPIYYGGFMHVSCICLNRKYWQQLHHRLNDIETNKTLMEMSDLNIVTCELDIFTTFFFTDDWPCTHFHTCYMHIFTRKPGGWDQLKSASWNPRNPHFTSLQSFEFHKINIISHVNWTISQAICCFFTYELHTWLTYKTTITTFLHVKLDSSHVASNLNKSDQFFI